MSALLRRRRPFELPHGEQLATLRWLLEVPGDTPAGGGEAPPPPSAVADPGGLAEAILHHRLAVHAARAIEGGQLSLPADEREQVAIGGARGIARGRLLRRELAALTEPLAAACEAPPICLKGPAAARLHPDPELRQFSDLDLMVPRERIRDAVDVLRARGYREVVEFRHGVGERFGHDVHLARGQGAGRLDIELHWRVHDDPVCAPLDHGMLAEGAEQIDVDGASVAIPEPARELLALAAHLLSDPAKRLIWLEDLRLAATRASGEEWQRAFALAAELDLSWVLHRGLDYPTRLLDLDRDRPGAAGAPPPFGPLRAIEELATGSPKHAGRLAVLPWRGRLAYLRAVLVPSRAGLEGMFGDGGASLPRQLGRWLRAGMKSMLPRR